VVSAPLYVYFGWLSDRLGRKPVMVAGMALALVLYFPASHWIAGAANPRLIEAQQATPIFVDTNPATCSIQFDPVGTAKFVSACDIAKSALVTKGINFTTRRSSNGRTYVIVGTERIAVQGGEGLGGGELKALKSRTSAAIGSELLAAGYPKSAEPAHADVGTGWVGGFLPVTSFALVAITGNIFSGLWYAVAFTAISVVVSLLFLKETAGRRLKEV
jgi:nitrate/nitrite transporter NarK